MTSRPPSPSTGRPWYRHGLVWLLIAFPASAVVGGAVTLWLAIRSADGLVVDDYYVRGKEINRVLDRDRTARRLGLEAALELDPENGRLALSLHGRAYDPPPRLVLRLLHGTRAGLDQEFHLARGADGRYRAPLGPLAPGHWYVQVETPAWRLTGDLYLPGTRRLAIAPAG